MARVECLKFFLLFGAGRAQPHPPRAFTRLAGFILSLHKSTPILTDPASIGPDEDNSFDVIVPSLPGFGFADCPADREQEKIIRHDAELLWRLMTEVLGYEHFAIAGGDGGSPLAQIIAIDHPKPLNPIRSLTTLPTRLSAWPLVYWTGFTFGVIAEAISKRVFLRRTAY